MRSPSLIQKLLSMYGSLMSPFHPTVVRGFSKYTRMTISSSLACLPRSRASRAAYSSAASGSWIEQGPMTTSRRSDSRAGSPGSSVGCRRSGSRLCALNREEPDQVLRRRQRRDSLDALVVGERGPVSRDSAEVVVVDGRFMSCLPRCLARIGWKENTKKKTARLLGSGGFWGCAQGMTSPIPPPAAGENRSTSW